MSATVTPQELGLFLDAVASAPVALRDVPRINSILARLVGLANQPDNIGALVAPEKQDLVRVVGEAQERRLAAGASF